MPKYPKRLIEVDLPIRRISEHARREKSIRHGHISTLHIWWARRPLAACRAVLCASLWPDTAPGKDDAPCPPAFLAAARAVMLTWATHERQVLLSAESRARFEKARKAPREFDDPLELRHALLDFIADFANWDNSTVLAYLDTTRYLTAVAHRALAEPDFTLAAEEIVGHLRDPQSAIKDWPKPLVVDPFAGGGSIPLEALRVGADAFASDLNPIPVLLNKVVLEYIPKYGQRLADEVRKWGAWIKEQAEQELAEFYPKDPDGATPIAYLWARTILSDAPSGDEYAVEVPLISSMWLSKKPHRGRALRWVYDEQGKVKCLTVKKSFRDGRSLNVRQPCLEVFEPKKPSEVGEGTVQRGSVTCPVTGFTTQVAKVRLQLQPRKGGTTDARLICVVSTSTTTKGRLYRNPRELDADAIRAAKNELSHRQTAAMLSAAKTPLPLVPHEEISPNELRRISIPIYGMATWGDAFSIRQLLALTTFTRLVQEAGAACATEAGHGDPSFGQAVQTLLALNVGKAADYGSALATWSSPASQETVRSTFSRQAIGMVWDYAEASPFAASSGGWSHNLGFVDKLIENITGSQLSGGTIAQALACNHPLPDDSVQALVTDPPYYDAVPYAHLSDFFYVWLRRATPENLHSLFTQDVAPKDAEIVVDRPHYLSSSKKDIIFYETALARAFGDARRVVAPNGVGTIVFASKTTSSWEAILKAVVDAGWIITGSWPIDTEREARMAAIGQARLASSVHLVVRPREDQNGNVRDNEVGDWRDVLQELPKRLHEWMPRLDQEGVVGADAIFACLGPALEIFSRYGRVERASGEQVTLKEYLEHVWAAVSREALAMVFKDADVSGFEGDARLTAIWLWTLSTALDTGKAAREDQLSDNGEAIEAGDEEETEEEGNGKKKAKLKGFYLDYDAARKIAQGLGAHLEDMKDVVEVKGDTARLLPVTERTAILFGKAGPATGHAGPKKKKGEAQLKLDLFTELTRASATEANAVWEEKTVTKIGETTLDRVHQSMILFATGRGEALKRFLVDDGAGKDPKFWRLAQALSALYPPKTDERRWVEGVMARKKGLGV